MDGVENERRLRAGTDGTRGTRRTGATAILVVLVLAILVVSPAGSWSSASARPVASGASAGGLHSVDLGGAQAPPARLSLSPPPLAPSGLGLHVQSLLGGTPSGSSAVAATGHSQKVAQGPATISGSLVGKLVGPFSPAPGPAARTSSGGPGWEGINASTSECGCAPPDVILATGPANVFEMNNVEGKIWTKTGTFVTNMSLWTFFGIATSTSISDPRILYDNLSQLWYASLFDISTNSVLLGASLSSNPIGAWAVYNVPAYQNEFPDQPYIGVSQWMVGITANDFNLSTSALDGTGYEVVNRTDLNGGTSYYTASNPQLWVPSGRAESALTPSSVQWFGGINPGGPAVFWVSVSGAPPAAPTYTTGGAFIAALSTPASAAQPGTSDLIDTSDNRAISAVWQNGLETVTFTTGTGCTIHSCIRLEQMWTGNSTLRQDIVITATEYIFYPAASVDSRGDLTLVVGLSSSVTFPRPLVFGQAYNEPGTISNGVLYPVAGTASITVACTGTLCRYGDYFGAAPDPASARVWTGSEWGKAGEFWSTWIQSFQTDPISVSVGASATPIDLGQSVTFTAAAAGGEGVYHYNWTNLPPGCTNSHVSTVTCTPSAAGTVSVGVNAADAFPTNASAAASFTVNPAPTLGVPTANKAGADVGQAVTFTSAAPVGGTPTFKYSWVGLPAGCGSATASVVVCTFTTSGVLSLTVKATDSRNVTATSPALSYTVSPALVVGTPTTMPASATTGTSFTFGVTVTGGSGGNQYTWLGLPTGCTSSSVTPIPCTPTAAGKYNVSVTVTDSNGAAVTSAKVLVTVTTPAATGLFGLPGATGWILLAVIVAAVVVLLLVLVTRRRKKPTTTPPAWQAGPPPPAGAPPPGAGGDMPPGASGPPPPP
ncbi:MAG: hypothetical protein L3K14_01785 [Thermoplasmata archaeon]|nr:hypothetical protein [Thermoplasmata archaeon]